MSAEVAKYQRNRIYISEEQQKKIKSYKLLLAGSGIGSNISECALRMGFENQTIIDGDIVEISNLNRQNYIQSDIGLLKTTALKNRLLSINPDCCISSESVFLNEQNIERCISGHDIAVNALDFQSNVPFKFDEYCQKLDIPVLHPYNIGWATIVFVIHPNGPNLKIVSDDFKGFEEKVITFLIEKLSPNANHWIKLILSEFREKSKQKEEPPPQLSVGSYLAAGVCSNLMFKLATGEFVKKFPDFYFVSSNDYEV